MSLQAELLAIEETFWTGGPEAYLAHCDDQCLTLYVGMSKMMKREDIAAMAKPGQWKDVNMKPIDVARLTGDSAVLAYEVDAVRADGNPHKALVSSTYVRREDGWKLAAHHQTQIPGEKD